MVHLIRASLRYASRKYWVPLAKDLRLIYTAPDEAAAAVALETFADARASGIQRSSSCGGATGASSCRSWRFRPSSGGSFTPRT